MQHWARQEMQNNKPYLRILLICLCLLWYFFFLAFTRSHVYLRIKVEKSTFNNILDSVEIVFSLKGIISYWLFIPYSSRDNEYRYKRYLRQMLRFYLKHFNCFTAQLLCKKLYIADPHHYYYYLY